MSEKIQYYTKKQLKERGFTDSIIKKLNITPNLKKQNPIYKKASPMCLFEKSKIHKIEKTKKFKELIEVSKKRRISSKKTVNTKKEKLLDIVKSWRIVVHKLSDSILTKRAIDHYNTFQSYKLSNYNNYEPNFISTDPEDLNIDFLNRIKVNYLRHELTSYEDKLNELFGKTGKNEAYKILKSKILSSITKKYPFLSNECKKQDPTNNNKIKLRS